MSSSPKDQRAREALGHDQVSALMTASRLSLQHPREIVEEYVRQGFDHIVLRHLSRTGSLNGPKRRRATIRARFCSSTKKPLGT